LGHTAIRTVSYEASIRRTAAASHSHIVVRCLLLEGQFYTNVKFGHGGLSAVLKLIEFFIKAGAAGINRDDQKLGTKVRETSSEL